MRMDTIIGCISNRSPVYQVKDLENIMPKSAESQLSKRTDS